MDSKPGQHGVDFYLGVGERRYASQVLPGISVCSIVQKLSFKQVLADPLRRQAASRVIESDLKYDVCHRVRVRDNSDVVDRLCCGVAVKLDNLCVRFQPCEVEFSSVRVRNE